jgi:hypothetical protein
MTTIHPPASSYQHRQRAPLCIGLYLVGITMLGVTFAVQGVPALGTVLPLVGLSMLVLAASFHYLAVEDEVDRLAIRFGPLPLFRRSVRYDEILSVETGRTLFIEGWGIHMSPRGGWVWNLWGYDCVVLHFAKGTLRIGTDDAANLAEFIRSRIGHPSATIDPR